MHDISERRSLEREQALLAAIVASSDAEAIISLALDPRIPDLERRRGKAFRVHG